MNTCKATTTTGKPCQAPTVAGSNYCFVHDPAHAHERAAARRRGGLNRRTRKAVENEDGPVELRTVGQVQEALERALADTWQQENSGARTQAVVRLCQTALKALEVGELEARLTALEGQVAGHPTQKRWLA